MNHKQVRVLVCPNAFKGSLTAVDAARAIAEGFMRVNTTEQTAINRDTLQFVIDQTPLADGGDGTLETLVAATGGSINPTNVHGPLGNLIVAPWGRLGGTRADTAVIEMAKASGLGLLPRDKYDPLNSTTVGTGELMLAAMQAGCRKLLVGIGGSATNDGGAGMATALGARLLDKRGEAIPPGGAGLEHLSCIDMNAWKLPPELEVAVACDVDNPLTGPSGASMVYGPQKGATSEMTIRLDAALEHYARILESQFGIDVSITPGSGAAGGLGAGLQAFCGAQLVPGTEMVLNAVSFDEKLRECGLIVTGEGILDGQTARGKVIGVVANRALAAGKPCIAFVGAISEHADQLMRQLGLTAAFSIVDGPMALEAAMRNASRLLTDSAERVARITAIF